MADKSKKAPKVRVEASEEQVHRQRRLAVYAMFATAAFAAIVIGAVILLGHVAAQKSAAQDEVDIQNEPVMYDPFYVLLIGSDTRKGTALYTGKDNEQGQVEQYADIITLMRVDPQNYTITLVTVPRDTVVEGDKGKINDALISNEPLRVVEAVERLTGVRADYYAMTTFATFDAFIDAIGGIDVDVPVTVTVVDPMTAKKVTVKAGKNRHLNGAEALVFSRARKEYETDQDALRQVNVRTVESAIINKVLNLGSELDLQEVLDAFEDNTVTNLDLSQVGSIAMDFMLHNSLVKIYSATGPYDGAERESDGLWVVDDDPETWGRIISLTDAGFDPAGVVEAPSFESDDDKDAEKAKDSKKQ